MSIKLLYQHIDLEKVGEIFPVTFPVASTIVSVTPYHPRRVTVYAYGDTIDPGTEYWLAAVAPSGEIPAEGAKFLDSGVVEDWGFRAFFELMR